MLRQPENPVKQAEEKKDSAVSTTTALVANYVENEFHIPIPHDCYCPITLELMRDPWMAADGYSYERAAIQQWLDKGKRISPLTGEIFAHTLLQPNHTLRTVMQDLIQKINPGLLTILKAKSDDMKGILLAIELREIDLNERAEKLQQKLNNSSPGTYPSSSSSLSSSTSSSSSSSSSSSISAGPANAVRAESTATTSTSSPTQQFFQPAEAQNKIVIPPARPRPPASGWETPGCRQS